MAGPSLLLVAVVGLVAWWAWPSDEPYVAAPPPRAGAEVDPAGAATTLQRLVAAIGDYDRDAARALAAPDDTAAAALLGDLTDTAESTRLTDLTMRYVDADGAVAADGTWSAAVDVGWAYGGFDTAPTTTEVRLRFRSTPDGVAVAGVGGGPAGGGQRTPVWMSGPMQVSRSDDVLVVAAAGTDLATYARRARAAIPTVSRVLTEWTPRLVVEVPADGAALEAALGTEAGYYAQIAAVTGSGGDTEAGAPDHVFVNPSVFNGLGQQGQQVVLAHEAVHVATDAPQSQAPTWLVEGFADYVALRETPLPLRRTARQAAAQVRDEGLPTALPTAAEFDTRGPHLGAVYEASWVLCTALADRGGDADLVRFYDAVSGGAPVAGALRADFGWDERQLVAAWHDRLAALPGASA
ncbi:hypothetical protein [Nocardioides litoris]|uniref:hypothetical protein n=1 Tax=Nocardioides litoris TaxID=1926648 RepID=UPI00111EF596|nr:hypothetical protein [Nocardioides litoris]